ncbi:RNA polymerase sigma factor, sigma-70 family [Micromonospora rhizosphaerae]|uniref:RNA polymerase sigma factor, sigma-70 family n=1 Tax=Micromonospora rhizosphaerae TaxID=568872 RepID=A0A1C6SWC3_9ACTN|nr:sigma-70 family RNA polymerase sigma factor [Micromonospora rhizosphaerae]SCL33649.1 RNA polymerase sigma factor, sigma-70 family [Micromonospora rhizosphaerae]
MAAWDRALTELVQQRGAALKRYGYLLCGNSSEAEDLVQDALVRTFTSSQRSDVAQVEQYVRKIMLNIFLDRVRRRRVWERLLPLTAMSPRQDQHAQTDLRGDLRRALMELSPRQRACVVLHYYLDLSVLESSDHLGLSPGTVKRHLHEARIRLADHLGSPDHTTEDGYATP